MRNATAWWHPNARKASREAALVARDLEARLALGCSATRFAVLRS